MKNIYSWKNHLWKNAQLINTIYQFEVLLLIYKRYQI